MKEERALSTFPMTALSRRKLYLWVIVVQDVTRRPAIIRRILVMIVFMIPLIWLEREKGGMYIIRYRQSPSTLCSLPTKIAYYLV